MIVRFNEKIYDDLNKVYWHGSQYQDIDLSKSKFGMFYTTPNFEYAIRYSRKNNGHWGYMMKCTLSQTLDIFNADDNNDVNRLRKYLEIKNASLDDIDYILSYLYSEDWIGLSKGNIDRYRLLHYLIDLNYDGFFNREEDYEAPAIGLFSDDLVKIHKTLNEQEIIDYINNDSKLLIKKQRDIKRLMTGDPYATGHLVPYDDLVRIYKARPSVEDYKEGLLKSKRYLESIYDKDPSGCRVRIDTLNRQINSIDNKDRYKDYLYLENLMKGSI